MNATNYNHELYELNILPKYIQDEFGGFDRCLKCIKCNLVVGTDINTLHGDPDTSTIDYFFLNGKEIFDKFLTLEKLNLTCEEFQIKNILE